MQPFRRQELMKCGKARCTKCQAGPSHGPYWYEYTRDTTGKLRKKYIGKTNANALTLQDYDRMLDAGMPVPLWYIHDVLGTSEKDSFSTVRRAYRELVRVVCPRCGTHDTVRYRRYRLVWDQYRGERR